VANVHAEKSSARSTAKQRAKVEKAIQNASKKSRKLAKSNPQSRSKLKKDPGVPNLFPFKDKVLREIEQGRQSLENERQRRRDLARQQQQQPEEENSMEVEDSGIARLAQLAEERDIEFEEDEEMNVDDDGEMEMATKKDTSRKAYNKEFKKVVEQADVILYVLDARDPEGTRSKDIETMIRESPNGEKQLLLILNKIGIPLILERINMRLDSFRDSKSMVTSLTSIISCSPLPFQHKSTIHPFQSPSKETLTPSSQCA
jgi:nuclear GTP-binding protein